MKKIYSSLFALITAFSMNAQLTQTNNAPAGGDTYSMYRCDSTTTSPGASGANALWNFSGITTFSNLVRNYAAQAVSTTTYPAANVGLASAVNDVAYLGSGPTALLYYGGNISVGLVSGSLTYTSPSVYASYPMSLNTTSTSVIGGSINIPAFSATGTFTGTSVTLADGSGTINLPGGVTFTNALRVLTTQTLYINTSFLGTNATVTTENYNYYSSDIKAPLFTISTSSAVITGPLGTTSGQHYVARHTNPVVVVTPTNTVGVTEIASENFNFTVFPNPSTTNLNFATNHPAAKFVSVFDITGKLIEKQILTDGKIRMDVSYNRGLYLYTISSGDNKSLKSGKFTVSQ